MKKILSILSIGLSMLALSSLTTGCVEEIPEVVEELELSNMLTPSSISGLVDSSTGTTVTFTWTNSNAVIYYLEVYGFKTGDADTPATADEITEEMLAGMEPAFTAHVEPSESGSSTSYTKEDLEPEMSYYARVCAQSSADPETKTAGDSKWAYVYPIDTYSVMDQLPSFSVKERTSTTITVQWTVAEGDTDGINQIRVTPHPTDASQAFLRVDVEAGATEATISSLNPSEKYTVALHYNSANRGQMFVWTRPSADGAIQVSTADELKQALIEAADCTNPPLQIEVAYNDGIPYEIGQMDILGPVEIYGAQTVDGDSPVIIGYFDMKVPGSDYTYTDTWTDPNSETGTQVTVSDILGATSLRVEALAFEGNAYEYNHHINYAGAFPSDATSSYTVINCDISGFKRGLMYTNQLAVNFGDIRYDSNIISDIAGDGGDAFDTRAAGDATTGNVNSIVFENNTFNDGMRTFVRWDVGTIGSLTFSNNTVNNLCYVDNSNNNGIFHIQATCTSFKLTDNLFLNCNGNNTYTVLMSDKTKVPTEVSGNFYYNLSETFFAGDQASTSFSEEKAIAGGGAVLSSDPCENSARGIFNVTDASVLNAAAGDPRWLVEYVPEPMADLEPVQPGDTWTLNSTSTYGKSIEETTVIENMKFIVASSPINIVDEGMEFSAEATLEYSGVPVDCAIAFMTDTPGSIFASAVQSGSGTVNDHITVAVGPADGSSATIVGAIPVGAYKQKVVFDDIDGESLVYLYACGPVVLSGLEWSDDVNTGSSALADPEVTADVSTAGALTLSWDPVENAGSYIISFGAKEPDAEYAEDEYIIDNVTATSYTWENFPSGTYTVNVQAVPAEPEKYASSLIVGKSVTVGVPASMPQLTQANLTQDDMAFLYAVTEGKSIDGAAIQSIYYKGFLFTGRSGKTSKFNSSVYGAFFNTGGSSDVSADNVGRTIRFVAGGAGKLSYVVVSNGSDERTHAVSVNNTEVADDELGKTRPQPSEMPSSWADDTYTQELSTVAGDVVDLYSTKSVNYISVTWEPAGGLPPVAGLTPVTETTTWGSDEWGQLYTDYGTTAGYGKDFYITDVEYYVVNNLMIYAGADDTKFRVGSDNEYIQLASSSFDSSAQPSEYYRCFLRFRASGNGTLTLSARHTSGTADTPGSRYIYVAVGGEADAVPAGTVLDDAFDAGIYTKFTEHTWNISANNGDAITIFENSALRIDKITWTPAE